MFKAFVASVEPPYIGILMKPSPFSAGYEFRAFELYVKIWAAYWVEAANQSTRYIWYESTDPIQISPCDFPHCICCRELLSLFRNEKVSKKISEMESHMKSYLKFYLFFLSIYLRHSKFANRHSSGYPSTFQNTRFSYVIPFH